MHQISKIYFVTKLDMFQASSVPIIRSYQLYTWQLVRFVQVMWPLPRRVRLDFQFWIFDASIWLFYTELVTMHGHLNIKQVPYAGFAGKTMFDTQEVY